jgi:hypothetical protein
MQVNLFTVNEKHLKNIWGDTYRGIREYKYKPSSILETALFEVLAQRNFKPGALQKIINHSLQTC